MNITTPTIRLGDYNELQILRFTDHGAYLDGGTIGEILMPKEYVDRHLKIGDKVRVFVYLDQQERLVATCETPLLRVGQFGYLEVNWINEHGAFLNWGLMKDLFVPFGLQKQKMVKGRSYIVYVLIDDKTQRIVGSAKIQRYLQPATYPNYYKGKEVDVLIVHETPLGWKAIVDNQHEGLIYKDQIYEALHTGDRLTATVLKLREDGKLDLGTQKIGKGRFIDFAEVLLEALIDAGGTLPYSDHTPAEEIRSVFNVSKKTFKKAIGTLYKEQKIVISSHEISLVHK